MLFKFPSKRIVLDCFTYNELILQTAPITYAIKSIPDWWKQLPTHYIDTNSFFPTATMKNCVGMVDYYNNSISIPLWSDLAIKVNKDKGYQWLFSDKMTPTAVHQASQGANFLPNYGHLKVESPWLFQSNVDVKWVWSQPIYNSTESIADIKVLPGVVNFYNQPATNINLLIPLSEEKRYIIPQGQVMAHITPMSDSKVILKRHLVSHAEYSRISLSQTSITFLNKYKAILKQKQKFSDCPYHKD